MTVIGVPDRPGLAAQLFRGLADRNVNVDMIVQNTSLHGTTDISFTVPGYDLAVSTEVCEGLVSELGAIGVNSDADVARVSLVGAGMKTHPGVTALTFETLAAAGHQHRDDLHVVDPDLLHDPRLRRRGRRSGPSTPRSSSPEHQPARGAVAARRMRTVDPWRAGPVEWRPCA